MESKGEGKGKGLLKGDSLKLTVNSPERRVMGVGDYNAKHLIEPKYPGDVADLEGCPGPWGCPRVSKEDVSAGKTGRSYPGTVEGIENTAARWR